MSDSQWLTVAVVVAILFASNALFLYSSSKRKAKRHKTEARINLDTTVKRSATPRSRTSTPALDSWEPNSNQIVQSAPIDITQPEALLLEMTRTGPKQAPASISKSHDLDD